MKLAFATAPLQDAELVVIGVPDESGSLASRSGMKKGPEAIRKVTHERCVFKKKGGRFSSLEESSSSIAQKVHDYGDVDKKKLPKVVEVLKGKVPIILGGDHSVTLEALKNYKEATVVYFSAYPEVIATLHGTYSILIGDYYDLGKCIQIGVREPEIIELSNIKKETIETIKANELFEQKIEDIWKKIDKKIENNVYISLSIDVFDPCYAPGVSSPSPGGLNLHQVLFLIKKIIENKKIVGADIVELNPRYDVDERTAHLATKLLYEIITNYKPI
jgi:agmatinase